jgi:hypothetical protein
LEIPAGLAQNLRTILGATLDVHPKVCGLQFDADRIERFIANGETA